MVLIALITPVIVVGLLVSLLWGSSTTWRIMLGIGLVAGVGAVLADRRRQPAVRIADESDAPELTAIVHRLCVVADIAAPEIVIERSRQPNSWLLHVPRRPPRLYVTTGLLELLDADELAAVVGHELSHLANGDATLMTVVGMPGMIAANGGLHAGGFWVGGTWVLKLIGWVSAIGTNSLSRRRELAADRGACALTGRPSALASALIKVSDGVTRIPRADLRKAALADSFRLVPTSTEHRWCSGSPVLRALAQTHPPLARRLKAIEQLEQHLQHARGGL
jgi:heat shock protein HtpX